MRVGIGWKADPAHRFGASHSVLLRSEPSVSFRMLRRVAEREGFEPPMELPPCRISSAVQSTTLPPLREVEPALPRLVETGRLMA